MCRAFPHPLDLWDLPNLNESADIGFDHIGHKSRHTIRPILIMYYGNKNLLQKETSADSSPFVNCHEPVCNI